MRAIIRLSGLVLALVCAATGRAQDVKPATSPFEKWEKSIQAFEQQDAKQAPPQNEILFVGSSSIRLWKLEESFPNLKVINRGFGGSQIVDSTHFAERLVIKHQPRVVVFYAGDNDLTAGKSPEQMAADFKSFVGVVRPKLPTTQIHFISIKPSLARWKNVEKVRAANGLIRDYIIQTSNVCYIDVFHPMLGEDGKPRPELFVKDGLHMTADGYKIWAELLMPFLCGDS